jgi:hypothetical protein
MCTSVTGSSPTAPSLTRLRRSPTGFRRRDLAGPPFTPASEYPPKRGEGAITPDRWGQGPLHPSKRWGAGGRRGRGSGVGG